SEAISDPPARGPRRRREAGANRAHVRLLTDSVPVALHTAAARGGTMPVARGQPPWPGGGARPCTGRRRSHARATSLVDADPGEEPVLHPGPVGGVTGLPQPAH